MQLHFTQWHLSCLSYYARTKTQIHMLLDVYL